MSHLWPGAPEVSQTTGEGACDPREARLRRWGRILARVAVFGSLFVLSGVVFCAVYLLVRALQRHS